MNKLFVLISLFFSIAIVFAIDIYIEKFTASSNGKDIVIEFKTINERNIILFEIERSVNNGSFKKITSILPKGYPYTYKYTDQEAFLKNVEEDKITSSTYSYRLKILFNDNSYLYSNAVSVSHKVNGIYRTWGMIKEMFR